MSAEPLSHGGAAGFGSVESGSVASRSASSVGLQSAASPASPAQPTAPHPAAHLAGFARQDVSGSRISAGPQTLLQHGGRAASKAGTPASELQQAASSGIAAQTQKLPEDGGSAASSAAAPGGESTRSGDVISGARLGGAAAEYIGQAGGRIITARSRMSSTGTKHQNE